MRPAWLTRRRTLIGLAIVAVGLVLWFWLRPERIEVETARANLAPLQVWVSEDGRTRTIDRYVITAPVAGQIRRLTYDEGERVNRGEVIAELEPTPLDATTRGQLQAHLTSAQAQARAAQSALSVARSALDQAARELARRRKLEAAGAISREQLEQYDLTARSRAQDLTSAREAANAAAADVRAARAALLALAPDLTAARVFVRAPAPGAVLRIVERSERVVAAGAELLEIGDADALEAIVDVLSADAARIRPGMPAIITGWGGDPLNATVRQVEPAAFTRISALGVEEQRVNVLLAFEHCPESLGDGFWLEASIKIWSSPRTLVAPAAAVFRNQNGWAAFRIERGRARLQPIRIGERDAARVQVLEGLAAGDEVVLFPGDQLADGARVKTMPAAQD